MKKITKLLSLLLVTGLVGCNTNNGGEDPIYWSFSLRYANDCPAYSFDTTVTLIDDTLQETVGTLELDEDGLYAFEPEKGHEYHVEVELGKGFTYVEENNSFVISSENQQAKALVTSQVIEEEMPANYRYATYNQSTDTYNLQFGQLMYDFSFVNMRGQTVSLAETLKTKKVVAINFWATWCGYCIQEFPAINTVYQEFKEEASVFALSYESSSKVLNFTKGNLSNMSYDVGTLASLFTNFSIIGYPTTMFIDRYGRIAYGWIGGVDDEEVWREVFSYFTAEDYAPEILKLPTGEEEE